MKHQLALLIILTSNLIFGQAPHIEWGKLEGRAGSLIDVLPFHGKDFYTVRWQGGNAFGGYYLTRFDELIETKSKRLSITVNQNIANIEEVLIVNEQPVVILTNVRDGQEEVYLQHYDYDLKPKGDAVLLTRYALERGTTKEPIKIIQSKDKKHFAVLWLLAAKKNEKDLYGYAIFDSKLKEIDKGEYEVPIQSQFAQISNHILSNTGDYFLVLKEFENNSERRFGQSNLRYKAMHIYQVTKAKELEKYTIPVEGKRIEALSVNTDNQSLLTLTGVYGSNDFDGVKGVFFMQLDFQNKTIIQQGFQEFEQNFITEEWSDRALEKMEKRMQQGKGEPAFYNYKMKEAQILPDSSIIGVMEQNYVEVRSFSDMRSIITYSYIYHYNDIIAFKIGKSGNFDWIEKIKKSQVSTNDGGPFSSFASVIDGDQMRFIFNDSYENYDENGKYLKNQDNVARFTSKKNVVTMVDINLENGLQNRYPLFSRKETKTLAVPKLFAIDYLEKTMLLFTTYNGRELFGTMKLK